MSSKETYPEYRQSYNDILEAIMDKMRPLRATTPGHNVVYLKARQLHNHIKETPDSGFTKEFTERMSGEFVRVALAGLATNREIGRGE